MKNKKSRKIETGKGDLLQLFNSKKFEDPVKLEQFCKERVDCIERAILGMKKDKESAFDIIGVIMAYISNVVFDDRAENTKMFELLNKHLSLLSRMVQFNEWLITKKEK